MEHLIKLNLVSRYLIHKVITQLDAVTPTAARHIRSLTESLDLANAVVQIDQMQYLHDAALGEWLEKRKGDAPKYDLFAVECFPPVEYLVQEAAIDWLSKIVEAHDFSITPLTQRDPNTGEDQLIIGKDGQPMKYNRPVGADEVFAIVDLADALKVPQKASKAKIKEILGRDDDPPVEEKPEKK